MDLWESEKEKMQLTVTIYGTEVEMQCLYHIVLETFNISLYILQKHFEYSIIFIDAEKHPFGFETKILFRLFFFVKFV